MTTDEEPVRRPAPRRRPAQRRAPRAPAPDRYDDYRGSEDDEVDDNLDGFIAPEDDDDEEDDFEEGEVRPRRKKRREREVAPAVPAPVKRRDTSGPSRVTAAAVNDDVVIPMDEADEELVLKGPKTTSRTR